MHTLLNVVAIVIWLVFDLWITACIVEGNLRGSLSATVELVLGWLRFLIDEDFDPSDLIVATGYTMFFLTPLGWWYFPGLRSTLATVWFAALVLSQMSEAIGNYRVTLFKENSRKESKKFADQYLSGRSS